MDEAEGREEKTRQCFLYFLTLSSVYDLLSCCRNAYSIIFTHLSYFSREYLDICSFKKKRFSLFFMLSDFSFPPFSLPPCGLMFWKRLCRLIRPLRILVLFQVSFFFCMFLEEELFPFSVRGIVLMYLTG